MPLFPPSFNGTYLFGVAVSMKIAEIVPVEVQQTNYPRVNGVEEMDLGDRGAWTTVTGRIFGDTPADLSAAMAQLRAARRWGKCTLVDNMGYEWPYVRLATYEWGDRVSYDPGGLGYTRTYTARFFHPVLPDA